MDPEPGRYVLYIGGTNITTPQAVEFLVDGDLKLSTKAHNVNVGDYFTVNAAFKEMQESNAVVLNYTFDGSKFEYAHFEAAAGVEAVDIRHGEGFARVTLRAPDYDAQNLGDIMLRAKENAVLVRGWETIAAIAEFVLRDADDEKTVDTVEASVSFITVGAIRVPSCDCDDCDCNPCDCSVFIPGVPGDTTGSGDVTLIDLSNMVDWFGIGSSHLDWETKYIFFDFNNNGEIDIYDIVYVAKLITG
jgi:hypothetical protein